MPTPSCYRGGLLSAAACFILSGCSVHGSAPAGTAPVQTLKIMALGDSITRGSGDGFGNYRRPLQSLLTRAGHPFQFVGSNTEQSDNYHGSDPEQTFTPYQRGHEGYGGFRIDQIASDGPGTDDGGVSYPGLSKTLAADAPDTILLMLGTNDVNQNYDPGGPGYRGGTRFAADAAGRLSRLVDALYAKKPGVAVVLATITPLKDPANERKAQAYNTFVPQIVAEHLKRGDKIILADMYAALTTTDLSGDGVHPTTVGYDKMARVWFTALTGHTAPPLPPVPMASPGPLAARNIFAPSDTVTASGAFAGGAFTASHLTDGTSKAFVFGDAGQERVSITGFHGPISRLRFFDTPSYTGRTPRQVTIYASPSKQTSLEPGDYTKVGTFPLPTAGDAYKTPTVPAVHPAQSEPAVRPDATISYVDLSGLTIPAGAQSVLLDFSKVGGDGDGLSEIQAFAPQ